MRWAKARAWRLFAKIRRPTGFAARRRTHEIEAKVNDKLFGTGVGTFDFAIMPPPVDDPDTADVDESDVDYHGTDRHVHNADELPVL